MFALANGQQIVVKKNSKIYAQSICALASVKRRKKSMISEGVVSTEESVNGIYSCFPDKLLTLSGPWPGNPSSLSPDMALTLCQLGTADTDMRITPQAAATAKEPLI